jgi:DNA-binding response OmpR family regulator
MRRALPILIISGHSAELVDPDGALHADVLVKPFAPEELLRRVRATIDARTRR